MNVKNRDVGEEVKHQERLKATSNFKITKLTPVSKQKRFLTNSWKIGGLQKKLPHFKLN